jgi:cysteine desulfurase/selenocysteine lyase
VPSAIPFPGDAELRSLLAPRMSSPASAELYSGKLPGASGNPVPPAQLRGADAPGAGAIGTAGNSNVRPSPHGAPLPGVAAPAIDAFAVPLPELAALSAPLAQPTLKPAEGFTPAAPGTAFYFLDESRLQRPAKPEPGLPVETAHPTFDVLAIRRDFPILQERVNGKPLIWLDNAATTQKPYAVIERLAYYYKHENSNIHRAAHELAARATDAYEDAREKTRRFLNASSTDEIVFVRGATEAINLVAQSWGRQNIAEGDEILITWLEHHANIVPWQQLCTETGAVLRVAPVDDRGEVRLDAYESLLGPRTKLVSFTQVSNALGTVTPAREMVEMAHRFGARVLVDGAQAVSHMPVEVQALGCDWYVFSGHKVFAPTGIGVLYGRKELLESMPPWQGGGNMIADVTFEKTVYQPAPARFEAGTGNIADAVGLGAAIDYLDRIGMENVARHEQALIAYATKLLSGVPGLRIIGTAVEKAGVISFVLSGKQSEGVGQALNQEGIAVRAGHHCAQPILRRFGLESTVRPSFALYNTCADIDTLVAALHKIQSGHNPYMG